MKSFSKYLEEMALDPKFGKTGAYVSPCKKEVSKLLLFDLLRAGIPINKWIPFGNRYLYKTYGFRVSNETNRAYQKCLATTKTINSFSDRFKDAFANLARLEYIDLKLAQNSSPKSFGRINSEFKILVDPTKLSDKLSRDIVSSMIF